MNAAVQPSLALAPDEQLQLFDAAPCGTIASNAHARNAYGRIAEELSCAALGLKRIPINGAKEICFDAQDEQGTFFEIKSVYENGKLVIYDWRREKEAKAGVRLVYLICVHRARYCRSYDALLDAFSSAELWLVPVELVHQASDNQPLRTLGKPSDNPRAGYNRKGYIKGYRNVPLPPLAECLSKAKEVRFYKFGRTFNFTVRS